MTIINELLSEFKKLPDEIKSLIGYINSHPKADYRTLKVYWINISKNLDEATANKVLEIIEKSQNPILTQAIIDKYAHVVHNQYMLKLIIDTSKNKIYLLPKEEHHLKFTSKVLNIKEESIIKNPDLAKYFVGVTIIIKNNEIDGIIVGGTGLTLGANIKYDPKVIDKAFSLAFEFIIKGKFPYGRMRIKKVV